MRLAYYPGCLPAGSSREYDLSVRECAKLLGDELVEPEGWGCCGGASAASAAPARAKGLAEAVLQAATQTGADPMLVPCPYCYDNLRFAAPKGLKLLSPIEYLSEPSRLAAIGAMGKEGCSGLRAVFFPGCREACRGTESARGAKALLEIVGAEVVDWLGAQLCCGGWRAEARPDEALEHVIGVLQHAHDQGAQAIVTGCPVCQTNLDVNQVAVEQRLGRGLELPIFYITELVAHALGSSRTAKWYRRHVTSPWPLIITLVEQTRSSMPAASEGGVGK